MAKTAIFTKRLLFFSIAIFAISVTAVTAYAAEEEKTPQAAKEESPAASGEARQAAQAPQRKVQLIEINPAARVNGVTISRAELDKSYNGYIQQRGMDSGMITNPKRYKKVQQEVLDGLVTRELLWQTAQKKNFIAKDEDVQRALSNTKSRFPSEDDFKLRLAINGSSETEYAEFLRKELSVRALVEKDIAQGLTVSDNEIHAYYEIIKVEEKKPPQLVAEKDVQEQIRRFLYAEKVRDAVQKRINMLRQASKVEILLP